MKQILTGASMLAIACSAYSAPDIYTNKSAYLAELASLGLSTVSESFENDTVWAASRNSIVVPGSTPSVTSKGIVWTSNYAQNNIATGEVGGAPAGVFAIYSLPHGLTTDSGLYCDSAEDPDIPLECFQNDGLKIESANGDTLYAFGGRIDTATSGKVTFLLDGVDINGNDNDNIDNWQREGDTADNWGFVGVIDTDGFLSAELRELRGKDYQQVLLFADDFTIGVSAPPPTDTDGDGVYDVNDNCTLVPNPTQCDGDGDNYGNHCDADFNNDGIVNGLDIGPLKAGFGSSDTVLDLNCDGIVNGLDIGPLKAMFGTAPGPSGLVP